MGNLDVGGEVTFNDNIFEINRGQDGLNNGNTGASSLITPDEDEINITFSPQGCMDVEACNYDPNALCDDGSCEFSVDSPTNLSAEGGPARVILSWDAVDADSYNIHLADGTQVGETSSDVVPEEMDCPEQRLQYRWNFFDNPVQE